MLARVYRAIFVAEFQAASQYRVQSALWVLFSVIRPVIFLAAWVAAADAQGGAVGDYSRADFAAYYVAVTLVGQIGQSWNAYDFEYEIRQGLLSPKLLRPLHPLHYSVVQNIVWKIVTLPVFLPGLLLIAWTFGAGFTTEPWHLLFFVPSVLLAAALRFVFGWVVACAAFWTTRIHSIMQFYDRVWFLLAGQIAPLSLLPGGLALVGYVLPFGYMLWAPAEILRGGTTVEQSFAILGIQVVWLAVGWLAYVTIWRVGLRQFSAVGA